VIAQAVQEFVGPEKATIRALMVKGEPAVVGKDLCEALEIKDHPQALGTLPDDERGGCSIPTPGGDQEMIVVFEPGIYRMIFRSRKPEAEAFKRWVFHEVLPAIRKTGSYTAGVNISPEGRMTLLDWVESLDVDLREQAWIAKLLMSKAKQAAAEAGYRPRSFRDEDGLDEYPVQLLRYAVGLVEMDARQPVNRPFLEHMPRAIIGEGGAR